MRLALFVVVVVSAILSNACGEESVAGLAGPTVGPTASATLSPAAGTAVQANQPLTFSYTVVNPRGNGSPTYFSFNAFIDGGGDRFNLACKIVGPNDGPSTGGSYTFSFHPADSFYRQIRGTTPRIRLMISSASGIGPGCPMSDTIFQDSIPGWQF